MIIHVPNKNTLIIDEFKLRCCIGKNGINSNKKEGDYSTPKGLFNLRKLYFRKDRVGIPKCKINKKIIKKDLAWCDDPKHQKYNEEIKTKNKNLKERVFVESKNMDLLNYFQINGFSVSYWVPNYHFFGSLTTSFQVRMNLLKYQPDAISCNFNSLHFYTKKFPNYNFYCWVNKMSKESDKSRIIKKSENENIRIILTDFDENFLSTQ